MSNSLESDQAWRFVRFDLDACCLQSVQQQAETIFESETNVIIGITHVSSCINICRVPRKVFEHEAVRLSSNIVRGIRHVLMQ